MIKSFCSRLSLCRHLVIAAGRVNDRRSSVSSPAPALATPSKPLPPSKPVPSAAAASASAAPVPPAAPSESASEEDAASGECRERVARQAMPLSSAFAKVEEVLRKRDEDYEESLPKSRDLTAYTHHDTKMILMSGTMQNILRSIASRFGACSCFKYECALALAN